MKHFFLTLFCSFCLFSLVQAQTININEFMSSNDSSIQDEDGDFSDWIELYNAGDEIINLEAFSISDDVDIINKWVFPSVEISPNSFLIIFASGKDRYETTELHTNFKLKQSGEYLFLTNANNEIVSQIEPVSVPTDLSYGSITDGSSNMLVFSQPSPNASNLLTNEIFYSHPSGFYTSGFELNLISSSQANEIRYTLNGSTPNIQSRLFSTPIQINNVTANPNVFSEIPTTPLEGPWQLSQYKWMSPDLVYKANVIRFASFNNGNRISQVYSKTYFVDEEIENAYQFPIVSIITDSLNLFQHDTGIYIPGKVFEDIGWTWVPEGNYHQRGIVWERNIHISYFLPNGEAIFETDAGMRMRGWGSTVFPQKSFGVYFRKDYGLNKIEYPLFPNTNEDIHKRLVFRSSGNDFLSVHFRDALLHRLLINMDLEIQDFTPSLVFINGEYWGIHNMREKYDKHYFKYQLGIEKDNLNILGVCGSPEEGTNADYSILSEFILTMDLSIDENYSYVKDRLDIQNFIDYEIAEIYYANYDWPCNNYKIWKTNDEGSKWRYLIYDLDFSFGIFDFSSYDTPSMEHATIMGDDWPYCDCSNRFFNYLLENDEFKNQFINQFAIHLNTTFKSELVADSIRSFKALFENEMPEHIARWSYPDGMGKWNSEIDKMIEFAEKRPCFMRENIMNYFGLDEFGFTCDTTGNIENESHDIIISPNPVSQDYFTISIKGYQNINANYQIIGMDNRLVKTGILNSTNTIISTNNMSTGIYLLQIQYANRQYYERIIISK